MGVCDHQLTDPSLPAVGTELSAGAFSVYDQLVRVFAVTNVRFSDLPLCFRSVPEPDIRMVCEQGAFYLWCYTALFNLADKAPQG